MQPSSKRVLAVTVVLVLALIVSVLLRQPTVPDQDQIAAQLESARAAAEAHDTGGIMQIVSADYKDSTGLNVDGLHLLLTQAMRDDGQVQVTFSPPSIVVQGDTATSSCQMTVRDGENNSVVYDKPVTLTWQREDGRRLLVLPTKVWRVAGAQYQGAAPGEE